jgi:hypothetical protein
MLRSFDAALNLFEQDCYGHLHEWEFDPQHSQRETSTRMEAQVLATDIGYHVMILRDLDVIALQDIDAEISTLLSSSPFTQRPFAISKSKFGAAFKTTTFLFRAMQDALCRLLLSVHSQPVGNKTSIVKAMDLKKRCYISDHPLGALLADKMPEYIDWFKIHKTRRDLIKHGIPISYHSGKDHLTGEVSSPSGSAIRQSSKAQSYL